MFAFCLSFLPSDCCVDGVGNKVEYTPALLLHFSLTHSHLTHFPLIACSALRRFLPRSFFVFPSIPPSTCPSSSLLVRFCLICLSFCLCCLFMKALSCDCAAWFRFIQLFLPLGRAGAEKEITRAMCCYSESCSACYVHNSDASNACRSVMHIASASSMSTLYARCCAPGFNPLSLPSLVATVLMSSCCRRKTPVSLFLSRFHHSLASLIGVSSKCRGGVS